MAPPLELLCLSSGGDFCDVFAVEVPMAGRVAHLMGPIKLAASIPHFKLYKVSVPIDTKLKERVTSCKQELLLPHDKLSTVFPEPREGRLRILVKPCITTESAPPPLPNRPNGRPIPIPGARQAGGEAQHLVKRRDPEAKDLPAPVIPSGRGHRVVSVRSPGRACDNCGKDRSCEWVLDGSKCAKCMRGKQVCRFDGENSRILAQRTLTAAALGSTRAGGQGTAMGAAIAGGFGGRGQLKGGKGAKGGLGVDRLRMVKGSREGRGKTEDSVIEIESDDDDIEMVTQPPRRVRPMSQRKGQAEGTAAAGAMRECDNAGAPVHRALRHRAEIEAEREVVRRELSYRRSQIRVAETQIRGLLDMQAELEGAGENML